LHSFVSNGLGKKPPRSVLGLIPWFGLVFYQQLTRLVLDLHEVDYVSSAGSVALQTVVGRAASHGGKAVLCGVTSRVGRVLELSGFADKISIFPDLTAATFSFAGA
jgi:anti-anti-sigma regulatory factor